MTVIMLGPTFYDCLEHFAFEFGGIGAGSFFDTTDGYHTDQFKPRCVFGLACYAEREGHPGVARALASHGITPTMNDMLIRARNDFRSRPVDERISFREWCFVAGVMRAEQDSYSELEAVDEAAREATWAHS